MEDETSEDLDYCDGHENHNESDDDADNGGNFVDYHGYNDDYDGDYDDGYKNQ